DNNGNGTPGSYTYTSYDLAGEQVQSSLSGSDPLGQGGTSGGASDQGEVRAYDPVGNLTDFYDYAGNDHQRAYDGANRPIQYLDSALDGSVITTTVQFDGDGNVLALQRAGLDATGQATPS